jgi:starch-binding outer membrane protein SusE/F
MKKISILLILIAGLFTIYSCTELEKVSVSSNPVVPVISAPTSGSSLVMTKPEADEEIGFKWSAADYGLPLGVLYTVQIDKAGNEFASPVTVTSVYDLTDTLKYSEFNSKMVALEAIMETVNAIEMRIRCIVPNSSADTLYSESIPMNVTPYTAKDNIYLVGAFQGWHEASAVPMNRSLSGLKYELYVNFTTGNTQLKILPTLGTWAGDIGDDPANAGHLIADGEWNMWVFPEGYYRVSVDLAAMTWSTLATTWGIIGGFGADGNNWASDYATMIYNTGSGVWEATFTISAACEFKFRANAGWSLNFGDNGADGKLDEGGSNIALSSSGNYTVTLNLNPTGNPQAYTYTVVKN